MPIEELDSLLVLLAERKQKVENEEAESHTETLLDFLMRSQLRKQEKMNEVSAPFLLFLLPFQCLIPIIPVLEVHIASMDVVNLVFLTIHEVLRFNFLR